MHIEFDPTKDLANQDKHGVSLALAVELDWEAALVWVDERIEQPGTDHGFLRANWAAQKRLSPAPKNEHANSDAGLAFCHADLRYRRQRMDRRKILGQHLPRERQVRVRRERPWEYARLKTISH